MTGEPVTTQSCNIKPIDIQINGSDGPVNTFLTLGNGATVNNDGSINLTENINLQWMGTNVSSCVASDTATPASFSGYIPFSSSQTVTLSGNIKGTSSTNKISDTFKINCVSTVTGAQVTDSITANLYYTVNSNCWPNWQCSSWSTCANSKQARTCIDLNGCGSSVNSPLLTQSCVVLPTVNI